MKSDDARSGSSVPEAWLLRRVTLEEIAEASRTRDLIKPHDSDEWEAFKAQVRNEDEIWLFTSPEESFLNVGGEIGYVLIRNGEQVTSIVALRSTVRFTSG